VLLVGIGACHEDHIPLFDILDPLDPLDPLEFKKIKNPLSKLLFLLKGIKKIIKRDNARARVGLELELVSRGSS
jgi:hypothetical protein